MAIGRPGPGQATNTTLKEALHIGLDEALTALEESLRGLTDEQIWAFPFPDRHNVATIAMHAIENLDHYACAFQIGRWALKHEDRFDMWQHSPAEVRDRMVNLPTYDNLLSRIRAIREAATPALEQATERDLLGPRHADDWWKEKGRTSTDAYMRTIFHTMAHVRQIWFMRGVLGLTDKEGWPEQHWA